VIGNKGDIYKLNGTTGEPIWHINVERYSNLLGVAGNSLYVTLQTYTAVLDSNSGEMKGKLPGLRTLIYQSSEGVLYSWKGPR
jgi:outer membrane protein assembly factor BamB